MTKKPTSLNDMIGAVEHIREATITIPTPDLVEMCRYIACLEEGLIGRMTNALLCCRLYLAERKAAARRVEPSDPYWGNSGNGGILLATVDDAIRRSAEAGMSP